MPVDLKFYTPDIMEMESIDEGQVRMNYGTITPIKIKNDGTDRARDVIISSSTFNTLDELKEQLGDDTLAQNEYDKQTMASKWKSFCLIENGVYQESINLGNINAGRFLEGTQTLNETFSNKDDCLFQDVWHYCLQSMGNNALKIYKNEAKSQTAQRMDFNIGTKRDVQIMFKMNYERDADSYNKNNCLVIFPVRINDKGIGYILSFQFRASDGKVYFGVYKNGKGMVSNLSRSYGTRIMNTTGFLEFDSSKLMGARVFTDRDDNTCFQFFLNGEAQTLYLSDNKNKNGVILADPNNTHPDAGLAYFDVGLYYGDLGVTLSNFSVTTETDQQPVYVKTKIDVNATDGMEYKSAIALNYLEG